MIIGIDAGYGYVKTKNTSFPSGVHSLSTTRCSESDT